MKNQVKAYVNPNYDSEIGRSDVLKLIPNLAPDNFISFHHAEEVDDYVFNILDKLIGDDDGKDVVLITYSLNTETGRPEVRALMETGEVFFSELLLEVGNAIYFAFHAIEDLENHYESSDFYLSLRVNQENNIHVYVASGEAISYEAMGFIFNYLMGLDVSSSDVKELETRLLRNGVLMA